MARYIDADKLESELFRDGIAGIFLNYPRRIKFTIGEIRGMLKNERIAPTADVVPRAELAKSVEKLIGATDKVICEAKAEVARKIIEEIDNRLHDMAMEYHNAGHPEYFAVCEMVHHKVIRAVEKKYTEDSE